MESSKTKSKAKTVAGVKVTKFQRIISLTGAGALDKRSQIIFNAAKSKMNNRLQNLYDKRDELELEMLQLEDLSVRNANSLTPGGKNFDPGNWIDNCLNVRGQLNLLAVDIEVAEEFQAEYFTPEEEVEESGK